MKKTVRRKTETNVTDITTARIRRKAVGSKSGRAIGALSAPVANAGVEAASPSQPPIARDRAGEFLAEMGFQESEIGRIKSALPLLPIDAELVGRARAFVVKHESGWDHRAWTEFLNELAGAGYAIGVDTARYHMVQRFVGVLCESIRTASFHACEPTRDERAA